MRPPRFHFNANEDEHKKKRKGVGSAKRNKRKKEENKRRAVQSNSIIGRRRQVGRPLPSRVLHSRAAHWSGRVSFFFAPSTVQEADVQQKNTAQECQQGEKKSPQRNEESPWNLPWNRPWNRPWNVKLRWESPRNRPSNLRRGQDTWEQELFAEPYNRNRPLNLENPRICSKETQHWLG